MIFGKPQTNNGNYAARIPGVLQVVKKAGQYQLVIGSTVEDVYNDLVKMINIENDDSYKSTPKEKKNIFDTVISVITGSIAPAIPLLAGAGMGKVLLLILTISGLLSDKSQTYQILNLIFDTGYFFMPAFIRFSYMFRIINTHNLVFPFSYISCKCSSLPNYWIRTIFTSLNTFRSYFTSTIFSKFTSILFL